MVKMRSDIILFWVLVSVVSTVLGTILINAFRPELIRSSNRIREIFGSGANVQVVQKSIKGEEVEK